MMGNTTSNHKEGDTDVGINHRVEMLQWQIDMGADEAITDTPVNWFETTADFALKKIPAPAGKATPSGDVVRKINDQQLQNYQTTAPKPVTARPVQSSSGGSADDALKAAQAAETLQHLYENLCSFDGGHTKRAAQSTVFAAGSDNAPIMVIAESPSKEEDQKGHPVTCNSGSMMHIMLKAAGIVSEDNCYTTMLLPWRLMGNPTPSAEMVSMCLPFLKRHIELAAPRLILTIGKVTTQALLNCDGPMSKVQGRWHDLSLNNQTFDVMPLYKPSELSKSSKRKKETWYSMLALKHKLLESSS